ncbi:acetyl-CoA hydrolase/transferase family protein [Thermovenabulum gondwanense]|uniref:Succinyl-CoA:coenzyme A transferase n=1 Tax=Thermovenabulum gondwanense TaxID=520767 RepID=A0A162MJS6_9FIRM|nr:acetyl-CoA hydrolase/transferase family protein [Thermovenabulum gondwanense]KYO66383.1 Succinyl-CoA:coenzyme A transferase [Thermovenabulum gondwanense]
MNISKERLRLQSLKDKIMTAEEAANLIKDGMIVATSGFTPSGYPKEVPIAISKRAEKENLKITLYTGASVGDELDGTLSRANALIKRIPYQTNESIRNAINSGKIEFVDLHLSHMPQMIRYGFLGKIDVAIIEAVAIREDGGVVPATSVGNSPVFVEMAEKVIIELNESHPLELEGMHDIYTPKNPPNRKPIPLTKVDQRIGGNYIPCNPDKIAAIVLTNRKDSVRPLAPVDETSKKISEHLIEFLENEVKKGRLPKNLLPLQSGVGNIANAVLKGLLDSPFEGLEFYSEVIQDAVFDLLDSGKMVIASGTSVTPSEEGLERFYQNIDFYRERIILRPQEISNNPEIIRRLGVIAMNTAIEVDIYGHVNSTHIMGTKMMNGIGGSGDFTRNAYISIFATPSTAKNGLISCIVPMVSHVDHTEHDVMVVVTEQGLADLRGLSPKERAKEIIKKCAHPDFKDALMEYFNKAIEKAGLTHTPHILEEAFSWHTKFLKEGRMI